MSKVSIQESVAALIAKNGALSQWSKADLESFQKYIQRGLVDVEMMTDPRVLWCVMDLLKQIQEAIDSSSDQNEGGSDQDTQTEP